MYRAQGLSHGGDRVAIRPDRAMDVVIYFTQMTWIEANGRIEFADVVRLFALL